MVVYRIIGCGSTHRGDDVAGLLVVWRLRELAVPAYEQSGEAVALIESWQGCDRVILIDSVVTGGDPGTVSEWDGACAPVLSNPFQRSTHGFGVAEAVKLARALGLMPSRLMIYGIEGRRFDLGSEPSAEVVASSEQLARRLAGLHR